MIQELNTTAVSDSLKHCLNSELQGLRQRSKETHGDNQGVFCVECFECEVERIEHFDWLDVH